MKQGFKKALSIILAITFLSFLYYFYTEMVLNGINGTMLPSEVYIIAGLILLLIVIVYINSLFSGQRKLKEFRYRDKLFSSLIKNSNTIYYMYDRSNRQPVYISKNINMVLGFEEEEEDSEKNEKIIQDILNNPIIKTEMKKWDGKNEFVSQMVSYRHPVYENTTKRIQVKIYPFFEKKYSYNIVLISDVTKEHGRQHLLISQASDIKAREKNLNQITASSYDVEINVNLLTGEYSLRNLKHNIDYLGQNRKGDYLKEISNILEDRVHNEDHELFTNSMSFDNFKEILSNKGEPITTRYRLSNTNELTWLESTAFFTTNKGQENVIILTKNVTENAEYMREQNNLLQEALSEAKRVNDAKTDFLTVVSHEIRTPMNAVIGLSESVLSDDLSRSTREDIESINSASKNLLEIFDEMLDISKIESGILDKNEREYEVANLFLDVINITKERVQPKNLELKLNIDEKIPATLFGDVGKIRQVLLNLVNNAIQNTEEGSITISGTSEKKNYNTELTFIIEDTGIGLESEELDKLFDDSIKGSRQLTEEEMGLSISKDIIDLLNGKIMVESTVGKGSIFTVVITQKTIDEKPIGNLENIRIPKKRVTPFDASGKSVLIVDDNKLNIKVAEKLLKPYNIDITSVESGKDCIELIKNSNIYDLILLDQMMPEMSGVETLHEIKKVEGFNMPVVVLTADAIVGVREKYLSEGFDDYMSKPIDVNELNHLLKKYLIE